QTVEVEIFNTKGQLIRTLQSVSTNAGTHNLVWDSKDATGRDVTAGIYLYKVKGGRYSSSKKMILLK
ncbi:MAG: FlgD immunoglobulin-like domain containing protein, partial [Candidatus Cloacimonadaceae bacterium]